MTIKSRNTYIHELELMYWDTVIQVLGAWQNVKQPASNYKSAELNALSEQSRVEYLLFAAAGLGIGIIVGAIYRM